MQCQCNKSIKYKLLCLIQAKQKEVELNSFIEEGIEMIRNVNKECKCNVNDNFLKELVSDAINDMVNNDKVIMKTTIELNGKNDNKFYYVCINKHFSYIFGHYRKILKREYCPSNGNDDRCVYVLENRRQLGQKSVEHKFFEYKKYSEV